MVVKRLHQPLHDVADPRHIRRLRGHLYGVSQAEYLAKHCHRRCLRRHAPGARLGRGDRYNTGRSLDAIPDYFRVDAAAFLEPGTVSNQGVCRRRHPYVAGNTWCRIHPSACVSLHRRPESGDAGAICHRHGRVVLSGQRGHFGRRVFGLRVVGVAKIYR